VWCHARPYLLGYRLIRPIAMHRFLVPSLAAWWDLTYDTHNASFLGAVSNRTLDLTGLRSIYHIKVVTHVWQLNQPVPRPCVLDRAAWDQGPLLFA
jgi:hypothetical protein